MLNLLKYIYLRVKGAIQTTSTIFLIALIGFVAFKIGSCWQSRNGEPQIVVRTRIDTVQTLKEVPKYFHIHDTTIVQTWIEKIVSPKEELPKESREIIYITEDSIRYHEMFKRDLIYYIEADEEQIQVFTTNFNTNAFTREVFSSPDWMRWFKVITDENGSHLWTAPKRWFTFEGFNLEAEYIHLPERKLSFSLWAGLSIKEKLSFRPFLSSRGELGIRTNWRF